jgi:hypothetical protein
MSEEREPCFSISEDFGASIRRLRRFLNQSELAERWRLSERTIEKWRSLGQGPAFIRVGRRVIYDLSVIEAYETANISGGERR